MGIRALSDLPWNSARRSAAEDLGLTHSLIDDRTHGNDSLKFGLEDKTGPLQVMIALMMMTSVLRSSLSSRRPSAAEVLELTPSLIDERTNGPDNLKSGQRGQDNTSKRT